MHVAVYLPLLTAAVLGLSARWLAGELPPATATKLITVGAVVTSLAFAFSLGVLAFLLVARGPFAAHLGRWSVHVLAENPVPPVASAAAVVVVVGAVWSYAVTMWRQVCAALSARAYCARLGGEPGRLVVLDAEHPDAYALSAGRGRIVVTRSLLQRLDAGERRALLAHERAHLTGHHHRYRLAVVLAASICPLLRPAREAVSYATERWADEVAAAELSDRTLVAATLARTSLLVDASPRRTPALALRATGPVVRRVEALSGSGPRQRPLLVLAVVVLMVVSVTASMDARADTEHLLESAFVASAATSH
jgi:Zn-dependent protease with chaperone function